ncbi:MAG: ATP:cob(I)alamin adenosyltransferase [Gammaproteobacteria bacterium]|nr:ATP:cob(I)alamin adenosyltransferase [Gammaproteobacteria bacterium]
MGRRLSRIYTKTGDSGETGLGDGSRIEKTHPRILAIGAIDELNSAIGMTIEEIRLEESKALLGLADTLGELQHRIFDLGGELSIPNFKVIKSGHVEMMEKELDSMNKELEPLENFILPGGSKLIASCHMARAICRRAERETVGLNETEKVNEESLKFLNRLSDLLFVAARLVAKISGKKEVLWKQG